MLGNVASSSADSLPLRSRRQAFPGPRRRWRRDRSEVNRRQYEQTTPMPEGEGCGSVDSGSSRVVPTSAVQASAFTVEALVSSGTDAPDLH